MKLPIAGGLPPLRVVLADDALARDNEVVLVEPQPQVVAVENRLADGRGRQALSRALAALTNVTAAESGHLQFVGADALDSPQSPAVWRAAFGRPPARLLALCTCARGTAAFDAAAIAERLVASRTNGLRAARPAVTTRRLAVSHVGPRARRMPTSFRALVDGVLTLQAPTRQPVGVAVPM